MLTEEYEQTTLIPENPENSGSGEICSNNTDDTEINADLPSKTPELAVAEGDKSDEATRKNEDKSGMSDGSEPPVGRALAKSRKNKAALGRQNGEQENPDEASAEPEKMSKEKAMRVLEAIMFANGDEVYYDQFAKIIGYSVKEAVKIVDAYAKMYDNGAFPRGIRLVKYEKCCQLTTCPDLGEYVTQMIGIRGEPQLSPAAMETLAIIAYNQPVTRAYIEQVRRVDSTRPITVLLDRELIEEKGRLEVIGRPRLFGTTQNFLKTFGITSLSELPSLDLFSVEG